VIARIAQHAHFVLHLHHHHGVVAAVHLLQVAHEGGVRARIGIHGGACERGEDLDHAMIRHHARKALGIAFHPHRRIARHAVLPRGQPQKHDALVGVAGLVEEAVDKGEVIFAFFRLDEFPVQRSHHAVKAHRRQLRPDRLHVLKARRRRVVQFARQHQERFAVDDELGRNTPLLEMRRLLILRDRGLRRNRGPKTHGKDEIWKRAKIISHGGRSIPPAISDSAVPRLRCQLLL